MFILYKHVATRFAILFASSLGVLVAAILILEFLLDLDEILEAEKTVFGILSFLATRVVAFYLTYLIPISAFTGAFIATGLAARAHEITAMKAGGASPLRVLNAVFGLAAVISIGTFIANETIVKSAEEALLNRATGESTQINIHHGRIWYHTGRYIYNIARIQGEEVFDVRIFERDLKGRLIRTIEADRGHEISSQEWYFENAVIRTFEPDEPQVPPTVTRGSEIRTELDEKRSLQALQTGLLSQPLWVLYQQIDWDRADPAIRAIAHHRLSSAPLCLLLVFLAIPLGISVERTRTLTVPALEGIACIALLIAAREYTGSLSPVDDRSAIIAPWSSIVIFTTYVIWRLSRTPQ